mmetsp:Transcript_10030/g.22514  ORF Transcript_10030/g.22514 Transcript_10030/m.22514 type:complete len:204 (+) Transcript_10030:786-1397(+)
MRYPHMLAFGIYDPLLFHLHVIHGLQLPHNPEGARSIVISNWVRAWHIVEITVPRCPVVVHCHTLAPPFAFLLALLSAHHLRESHVGLNKLLVAFASVGQVYDSPFCRSGQSVGTRSISSGLGHTALSVEEEATVTLSVVVNRDALRTPFAKHAAMIFSVYEVSELSVLDALLISFAGSPSVSGHPIICYAFMHSQRLISVIT